MNWLKENPKRLATFLVGIFLYYGAKHIPAELLSPENVTLIQEVIAVVVFTGIGYFSRLTKSESELLTEIEKDNSKNQIIND